MGARTARISRVAAPIAAALLVLTGCGGGGTGATSTYVASVSSPPSSTSRDDPAYAATGECPERDSAPSVSPAPKAARDHLLTAAQVPPDWCVSSSAVVTDFQGRTASASSDPRCAAAFEHTFLPPADLGKAQWIATFTQAASVTSGDTTTTSYGQLDEILVQFGSVAEATREFEADQAAWSGCTTWRQTTNGSEQTISVEPRQLQTSAEQTLIEYLPTSGTLAIERTGSLVAFVDVSVPKPDQDSWPLASRILPVVSVDLRR